MMMDAEKALAAGPCGAAPARQLQEGLRHLVSASLTHLADGSALHQRCRDLWAREHRDTHLLWLAARISEADSILARQLGKALLPPRRKAKTKRRQSLAAKNADLNSISSIFCSTEGR